MCMLYDMGCSHTRALRLCRSSVRAGSAYGQFALGYAHQYGCGGAEEDYDAALVLYAAAADQGLADAQYVQNMLFARGMHVCVRFLAGI